MVLVFELDGQFCLKEVLSLIGSVLVVYNKIQYKHKCYYSGINPVEFRGHSKRLIIKNIVKNLK